MAAGQELPLMQAHVGSGSAFAQHGGTTKELKPVTRICLQQACTNMKSVTESGHDQHWVLFYDQQRVLAMSNSGYW